MLSALDSEGNLIDRWCKILVLNALHGLINELASQTPRRRIYGQWFIQSERFTILCDSIGLTPSVTRAAIEQRAVEMSNRKKRRITMSTYTVIEKGKNDAGLVLYDVVKNSVVILTDESYMKCVGLVESQIQPGDTYNEQVYDSTPYATQTYAEFRHSLELDRKFDAGE